jgi:signal transduction histidine kinase
MNTKDNTPTSHAKQSGNSHDSELNKEIERLSNKLLRAEQQRSHFLSHVLNEINNPLTSILGLTKSIMHAAYQNPELVHKQANLAFEEAFELDYQMRNIFAAAKIEAGNVVPRSGKVNVSYMVDSLLQDLQFKANRKKLSFRKTEEKIASDFFSTDPALLYAILLNLIGNAIEFSIPEQVIKIELQLSSSRLLFSITDVGPGISDEDQQHIFERFKQLDNGANKMHRGTGLGLSIVREYTDMLAGELAIKSTLGQGSTFILILPLLYSSGEVQQEVIFGEEEIF